MSTSRIYLDCAATAPVSAEIAAELAADVQTLGWNAGTRYDLGLKARRALDRCRAQLADALGCPAHTVVFTSGGTESNNLALHACCSQFPTGGQLWTSTTTHPSLAKPVEALDDTWQVTPLPRTPWGAIDTAQLSTLPSPDVVVLEWVNNEVGFVQPVDQMMAAARARNPNVQLLVDGAQGLGKVSLPALAPLAAFTFSGHKMGAPVGIGGVVLNDTLKQTPLTLGGGQEQGWRPGTVAVPLIRALCNALTHIQGQSAIPFSFAPFDDDAVPRPIRDARGVYSPCITMLNVAPVEGEVLQHHLEGEGVFIGTGSACSSARKSLSPIHKALGMDAAASRCTVRWSRLPGQDPAHLDRAWRELVTQWRMLKRFFET